MKKLRGLSTILCIAMLLFVCNFSAYADGNTITAYITISKYGEIVKDTNGDYVAEAPVELTGKENYTLDDVFREAHELYYNGGADAGYETSVSNFGYGDSLGIKTVWGDISGKYGYQINGGTVYISDLTTVVNEGDYVDLCIYENYWPDTERYSYFDVYRKAVADEKIELTLMEQYYDDLTWAKVDVPCADASIFINGEETGIKTDENGKFNAVFYKSGEYIITAKKMKTLVNAVTGEENTVNALTAPVCIVNITLPDEIAVIHNVIEKVISVNNLWQNKDAQMHWILADLAGYKELYPNSKNVLSEEDMQKCLDAVIEFADTHMESASDIAKSIIALRSMGYDAKSVYNKNGGKLDLAEKLGEYIDNGTSGVTSVYALPYIIIAMQEYATAEQKNILLSLATGQKALWQDNFFGVDGATPMILALAPYCDENIDVKNAVLEAENLVKAGQSDSGAIKCVVDWNNMIWGDSAASTGLAIAGLSAIGTDAETVIKNGNSLIDGIMSLKTADLDGFLSSPFDTEQGLRGLIAWKLAKEGKRIFDFSEYPKNTAYSTSEIIGGRIVVDENKEEKAEKVRVNVSIMVHDKDECNNSYTYKSNSEKYSSLVKKNVEIDKGATVYDATVKALNESGISYTEKGGYISKIGIYDEFDHGKNSGWMFKLNGKHQNVGSKDITLNSNASVLWFYTDDYTLESGSENYNKPSGNNSENAIETAKENEIKEENPAFQNDTFSDVKKTDWHYGAVKYVYENNLMSGTDKGFEPDAKMTRAMLVSVLFRLNGGEKAETNMTFNDIENGKWYTDSVLWAASIGIVSGVGDNKFAPDSEITREQMAVILYNFAKYKNQADLQSENEQISKFEDFDEVSDYAKDAILWANAKGFISGESETTLNPKNTATRAQIASLLMRYCEADND